MPWVTLVLSILMLGLAGFGFGGFLLVILPARTADLNASAAKQVAAAQHSTALVGESAVKLWAGITPTGSMMLSPAQMTTDLTLAQAVEKAADDATTQLQASEAVLLQVDAIPFQFRSPQFVATDRAQLGHLDKALQATRRLAFAASVQMAISQHAQQDQAVVTSTLKPALAARNWVLVARTAASIQEDLKAQSNQAVTTEALMDPLWAKWLDALAGYDYTAQQYALAMSSGQSAAAAGLKRTLDQQDAQAAAAWAAAQAGNAAWQKANIQPILDSVSKELTAGGAS